MKTTKNKAMIQAMIRHFFDANESAMAGINSNITPRDYISLATDLAFEGWVSGYFVSELIKDDQVK